jgi:hypothetical protein
MANESRANREQKRSRENAYLDSLNSFTESGSDTGSAEAPTPFPWTLADEILSLGLAFGTLFIFAGIVTFCVTIYYTHDIPFTPIHLSSLMGCGTACH